MTTDIQARPIHAALLDGQRRVLERIASGAPLAESLGMIATLVEQHADGVRCSALLVDEMREQLVIAAAPSLPASFRKDIGPCLRIGPDMGPCSRAAYLREPVYMKDIATDPRWQSYRDIAIRHGARAVWSTPILADDNSVLGIFAISNGEPGLPLPEHIQLIDMAVQMARVAIEAKRDEEALRRTEERLRHVMDTIPGMVWAVQPDGRKREAEHKAIGSLTAKERAIFGLITTGKSNVEVAEALQLSPRTVETYRGRLMEKLQVEDLVGLVKFAIRHGVTGLN